MYTIYIIYIYIYICICIIFIYIYVHNIYNIYIIYLYNIYNAKTNSWNVTKVIHGSIKMMSGKKVWLKKLFSPNSTPLKFVFLEILRKSEFFL